MQAQHLLDIHTHTLGCRSGKRRDYGALRQRLDKLSDLQICRPKILAPLAHAMGLVHCQKRNAHTTWPRRSLGKCNKARVRQAFGRHEHKLIGTVGRSFEHSILLRNGKRRVEVARMRTGSKQRPRLVFHKRDERAHHQGKTRSHERRHLVANGLTRTRGHHGKNVAPGKNRRDDTLLARPKRLIAKISPKRSMRLFEGSEWRAPVCYRKHL